jgi:hypothetical protein
MEYWVCIRYCALIIPRFRHSIIPAGFGSIFKYPGFQASTATLQLLGPTFR